LAGHWSAVRCGALVAGAGVDRRIGRDGDSHRPADPRLFRPAARLHGGVESLFWGLLAAPTAACLAAWLYRHGLLGESGLASAALSGTLAGSILLGPSMAYFFSRLNNVGGSKRVSSLLLHRDETAGEAIVPLNVAIRLAPGDASLFDRRALAHALSGSEAAAERDWGAGRRVRTPLDGTDDQPGLACKQRFNCPVWISRGSIWAGIAGRGPRHLSRHGYRRHAGAVPTR
jgi:hypothetical protein